MTNEMYLSQIGILAGRIRYHEERLRRLRLEADAVSSYWGERGGVRSVDAPYVRIMERIESCEEELERNYELLARLQAQTEETIARLPEDQRDALVLTQLEGISYETAARRLGVSEGTVKSRVNRARAKLKEWLSENGELSPGNHVQRNERRDRP